MPKIFNKIKINLLVALIKLVYGSCRWNIKGYENITELSQNNKSFILAFWHGNLLIPCFKLAKHRFHILAGLNKDAELAAQIGVKFGWKFFRGSSSKKGREAYLRIVNFLNTPGNVLAITPDGPKGPAKIPKPGIVKAAQKTGAPIIPIAGFARNSWGFTNWDTFFVAKPFTKINLTIGSPIQFSINDNFDDCIKALKTCLDKIENETIEDVMK